MEPGGSTEVEVEVLDRESKKPVKRDTEIALVVVDESILALRFVCGWWYVFNFSGYDMKNPLNSFFPNRENSTLKSKANLDDIFIEVKVCYKS